MPNRSIAGSVFVAVALFVVLPGCSGNRTGQVSGTVSVDGQPLDKGSISFIPVDGKGTTTGGEIKDGKYVVSKVAIGSNKVQVRYPKVVGTKPLYDDPNSRTRNTFAERLPKRYNDETELLFEVQPGKNEKNWDLSTR